MYYVKYKKETTKKSNPNETPFLDLYYDKTNSLYMVLCLVAPVCPGATGRALVELKMADITEITLWLGPSVACGALSSATFTWSSKGIKYP